MAPKVRGRRKDEEPVLVDTDGVREARLTKQLLDRSSEIWKQQLSPVRLRLELVVCWWRRRPRVYLHVLARLSKGG
jgi:hypothetical protein